MERVRASGCAAWKSSLILRAAATYPDFSDECISRQRWPNKTDTAALDRCGLRSASSERFSLEKRMKAFIGRFGVPSSRMPGVPYTRDGPSGVGLTEGVATA